MKMCRDVVPAFLVALFALRAVLAAALPLSIADVALAGPNSSSTMAEDPRILPYAKPGQLVDVGGRRINLYCTGAGGPTVVLMSGIASWSAGWYKTQPVIARETRVCALDRADYGFSDPPPRPQILSDVVDDLHPALTAAGLPGPYVLVGHSLGGIEARVYTQRWPKEVAGLVLVDTSPAGEGIIDEQQPGFEEGTGRESLASHWLYCALLAAHRPLDPSRPEDKPCFFKLPTGTPAAFRKVLPRFLNAYYFAQEVSLLSSIYVHRYDSADHLHLGAMPLVVLSPEDSWGTSTPARARFSRSYSKVWIAMHEDLARLSSRGMHRYIKGSGHEVQLDKPQVVIEAVDEVLRELHTGAKS